MGSVNTASAKLKSDLHTWPDGCIGFGIKWSVEIEFEDIL